MTKLYKSLFKTTGHYFKKNMAMAFLIVGLSVAGQDKEYNMRQYNGDNGLPQNNIVGITIDKNNFIWIATQTNGICRYDGQYFRLFNVNNTPGMEIVYSGIYLLPDGSIQTKDYFSNLATNISNGYVWTAGNNKTTEKMIAFHEDRLFSYKELLVNRNWPRSKGQSGVPFSIDDNMISGEHECYAPINGDIYYLNNSYHVVQKLKGQTTSTKIVFLKNHWLLGDLFVGYNNKRVTAYRNGIQQKDLQPSLQARSLMDSVSHGFGAYYSDGKGTFLVASNILYSLTLVGDSIQSRPLFRDKTFLANDISCIKRETISGNIYVGTKSNGLYVLSRNSIQTMQMGNSGSHNYDFVTDVVQLDNGDLLNDNQRFNIYTRKTKLLSNPIEPGALLKCKDGTLLYMMNDTLIWSDQDMRHVYLKRKVDNVTSWMVEDSKHGFVWVSYKNALWRFYKNGNMEKMISQDGLSFFFRISTNTMGIFLSNKGLYEYDIANNKLGAHPIISSRASVSFYCSRDSAVWVGTLGNGLYRYYRGRTTHFPINDKMEMSTISSIYEDGNGYLWMTTDHGLVQCLKKDLDSYALDSTIVPYYYHYNRNDGLLTNEFIGSSLSTYTLDSHGMLVYASTVGVAYFSPSSIRPLTTSGKIMFESLIVDGRAVTISPHIDLSPSFNNMSFFAVVPYYGNNINIILEYNINGLDNKWYRLEEKGEIVINRLPKGNYAVTVRKQNGFGVNNYQYATLYFRVLPHFYETWWFFGLLAFAIFFVVGFFFMARNRSLVKGKKLLEKLVAVRTKKLNESMDNLNTTIEDLHRSEQKYYNANEVKEQAIAIVLHDLKAPVRYLNMAAAGFEANIEKLSSHQITDFSKSFKQSTWCKIQTFQPPNSISN